VMSTMTSYWLAIELASSWFTFPRYTKHGQRVQYAEVAILGGRPCEVTDLLFFNFVTLLYSLPSICGIRYYLTLPIGYLYSEWRYKVSIITY
jgi:hypothetical protein